MDKWKVASAEELVLLGNAYVASRALHVVAQEGLVDLFKGGESRSVDEVAQAAGVSGVALRRILRVLCPFGVFEEHDDGTFSVTEVGSMLGRGLLTVALELN